MSENQEKINQLLAKLDLLLERQNNFSKEIRNLSFEINNLKDTEQSIETETEPITVADLEHKQEKETAAFNPIAQQNSIEKTKYSASKHSKTPKIKIDLEKFIGENLINKIGILITVIGVGIGAKYSIENNLISPLTRIILGYLLGLGLLGFGIKLKEKYENYSAVLVSGAIAIMYFITYASYVFYDLIPQVFAFALMVIFTVFIVIAAINYNKQVIAHIGLVGAYAVPFLLSEGSGKIGVLFSYMSIINIGILMISFKKYWKELYYASFGLTWLMYAMWYNSEYQGNEQFRLAFIFLFIFFIIFYLTILAYKILQKEKFNSNDIILLLINSFIFYGFGYAILNDHESGEQFLGLFTLANAMIHFIASVVIFKQKLADKNLFYLVSGLVLVFIAIAIPVQLDGNWVTLLWAGQAALLFWIGRTKNIPIYEKLSYPLMFISFFSIIHDWLMVYNNYYPGGPEARMTPLINIHFLSSLLFITAFVFINYLNGIKNFSQALISNKFLSRTISFSIPAILMIVIYYAFRMEIANYWDQLYMDSELIIESNKDYPDHYWDFDLRKFKVIWIINYSLLFVSALSLLNIKKFKNPTLGLINLGLIVLVIGVFLTTGLYTLSELRESYLDQTLAEYYESGVFNLGIRYVSYALVAIILSVTYKYIRQNFIQIDFKLGFDLLLHVTILWIASSELINWMDIADFSQSYKLGLSILWGIYALLLIALGIWKNNKYLRIGAMVLFGLTLVKLFFYDVSHLDTIAKTILFVSLGILLLIISFLYNKYKNIISDEVNV